ncbi:uncharacterized protein LOC126569000 [Anopheles aquasalis]|uniref:uncharacterized protein LOC126569000 n=1 Tax=Anopheles aquasalis TaxID=42839 RepID=UPI00215A12AE|nr:uncharacterized protein LOC126569000 [Anopheles aquasalis]
MAQSDRVTDLIMHYYMQHGRNRDLEKYLRLRRLSSATRSSSDGSLPNLCPGSACAGAERSGAGRSMENLSTLRQEAERQELAEGEQSIHRKNASAGSGKSISKSSNSSAKQAEGEAVGGDAAKGVTVREKKVEQKSGRNFNFNLESVIEINLPPPPTITIAGGAVSAPPSIMCSQMAAAPTAAPLQPPASTSEKRDPPFRLVVHENSTQTPVTPEDDPIRPVVKPSSSSALPVGGNEETLDSTKDLSPGSSVASNRQKLEWDSLGDIGYDSSERLQFCGAADLNETEKRCLQRYFARKGLTFDRSVVVVRQREEKERKVAAKATQQEASIVLANPGAQSTPKPSCTVATAKLEVAKATQTSLRPNRAQESRGIQAVVEGHPPLDREDKGIGTESCTMASVDAAESFEFFPRSAPESGSNGGTSVASLSTTSHHTSSTTSSSGPGPSSATLRPTFDDEVKLGLTLYNSIQELSSMPTGVKQSLIDKIFRKLSRHDPKRRTREQLLRDYATAVRERRTGGQSAPRTAEQANVYDDVSPSVEHDVPSGLSLPRPEEKEELDRSLGVEELVVDETKDPEDRFTSEEHVAAVEGSVKGLSSGSNDAQNGAVSSLGRDIGVSSSAGGLCSIQTVSSSHQDESVGTAKENVSHREPSARDKRVHKAMQDYLRPMTQSEVEYENFKELQKRARRPKEPQLAEIDREIEQLLVRKMLLLSADAECHRTAAESDKGLPAKPQQHRNNALPSERSGTVYTSVHESTSGSSCAEPQSSGRASKDSSAWNSHYHMAKVLKTRSKLETPTSPSDVSIPTFIKQKKDQFIENYDQVRHERRVFEEQNHIYTRPYSGQRSDALRRQEKENRGLARGKYVKDKLSKPIPAADSSSNVSVPSPRLLDGCAAFISSDSISIPVVTTLTNTTTTHHYDIKSRRPTPPVMPAGRTTGTQTTDSILRTKPIFGEQRPQKANKPTDTAAASVQASSHGMEVPVDETNCCRRTRECHCMCGRGGREVPRKTELIDGTAGRQDKQAQTKPSSIAYVITFEGGVRPESRPSATNVRKKTERAVSQLTVSSSPTVSESDEGGENGKDNVSEKMLTLREQFCRSCPTTLTRIEERRRCIGELNKLRSKRNAQRQRLLLLTSDDSLRRSKVSEGKNTLPPPPLTSKWRVFASTRAMRENTRRQVRNLPEVLRKKELERMNNLKRKNLIMKDVYNRNLQRKVLRGQVDLSNSVRVIQD